MGPDRAGNGPMTSGPRPLVLELLCYDALDMGTLIIETRSPRKLRTDVYQPYRPQ
jgi:hypothetical protein